MTTAALKSLRRYRAVCFDMDGTLLPMELDAFLKGYFGAISKFVASTGRDAESFVTGLKAGTAAMAKHDGTGTNAEAFWSTFFPATGLEDTPEARSEWLELLTSFYLHDFGLIGADVIPNEAAARAVNTLAAKGYPLALLTMPMFPLEAVEWRLKWANVDPAQFERLTTYDNSTSTKPKLEYYAENLAALGLTGEDVLMVGNNTVEDGTFAKLGADVFFVTDHLLDPLGAGVEDQLHGTMEEFALWCEALPECAEPATNVQPGRVPREAMLEMLATANGAVSHEDVAAAAKLNNEAAGDSFL